MKLLKKILGLLMGIVLISIPTTAHAESMKDINIYDHVIEGSVTETIINEYDILKGLQNTDPYILMNQGYSLHDIAYLKEFDYEAKLKETGKLSQQELIDKGYSRQAINNLKSDLDSDWTEEEVRAKAANLRMQMGINYVSSDKHNWTLFYSYGWITPPQFKFTDILGVRASGATLDGAVAIPNISNTSIATTQYKYFDGKYSHESTGNYKKVELNLSQATFPLLVEKSNGILTQIVGGYGYINFLHTAPLSKLTIHLNYGHASWDVSPTVSISAGNDGISAGLGIDFSPLVSSAGNLVTTYLPNGLPQN
jgi:hypothetical protein